MMTNKNYSCSKHVMFVLNYDQTEFLNAGSFKYSWVYFLCFIRTFLHLDLWRQASQGVFSNLGDK